MKILISPSVKALSAISILTCMGCTSNSPEVTKTTSSITALQTTGNLKPSKALGCVSLSKVTNQHTPADILTGLEQCIEDKDFDKASKLFAIAGVYGNYDKSRVEDKTAHQALSVLNKKSLVNLNGVQQEKLFSNLEKSLERGSTELNNVCQTITKIGHPTYHPTYMIQHGLKAFSKNQGNGLVKGFSRQQSFDLALKNYLHCGE